jgi:hypothetical protein
MSALVPLLAAQRTSSAPWSGVALISGALVGGWEIGVTMNEIPFAVDAAIDVRHADRHRGWSVGIDRYLPTLEADRVSEVTAFKRNDVLRD